MKFDFKLLKHKIYCNVTNILELITEDNQTYL